MPLASPREGGRLVFGVIGEPATFDPNGRLASDLTHALRAPLGSFEIAGRTPGLEVVYRRDPEARRQALLETLIVRFVQTLDLAIELLAEGRLDAAALPATVNLTDRLAARGLEGAAELGRELVYLDLRGSPFDADTRRSLLAHADVDGLGTAFVRELGRPVRTLHPDDGGGSSRGPFGRSAGDLADVAGETITLGAPVGDELLALLQRALHDDWERAGLEVDLVTIDARTFYGAWAIDPQVDVALRRSRSSELPSDRRAAREMSFAPLFQMAAVVAWREGVHRVSPNAGDGGPLVGAERWWIDG